MNSLKILVLCGGLSTERKISFSSGSKICAALRAKGHKAVLADMYLGLEVLSEEAKAEGVINPAALTAELLAEVKDDPAKLYDILPAYEKVVFDGKAPDLDAVKRARQLRSPALMGAGVLELCMAADVVYVALHGKNGEDGRVQATLETLGIPHTGSEFRGACLAMDKTVTKEVVAPFGIPMPAYECIRLQDEDPEELVAALADELPLVLKTPEGGSSIGVYICKTENDLKDAVRLAAQYSQDLLVEQFVEGREFTCAVLQGRALPSVEIAPKTRFYDYENKYKPGATEEICPGRCTPEVEQQMGGIAVRVHEILGLSTYSRSDFIVTPDNEVYFLEVNTLPGMTPTSLVPQEAAAVGITYEDLCETIVMDALGRTIKE